MASCICSEACVFIGKDLYVSNLQSLEEAGEVKLIRTKQWTILMAGQPAPPPTNPPAIDSAIGPSLLPSVPLFVIIQKNCAEPLSRLLASFESYPNN